MAFECRSKEIETRKFWDALISKELKYLTSFKIYLEMTGRQKFPKLADITIAKLVEFAAQNPIVSTYVITGDTSEVSLAHRKSLYALAEQALKEELKRDFMY